MELVKIYNATHLMIVQCLFLHHLVSQAMLHCAKHGGKNVKEFRYV